MDAGTRARVRAALAKWERAQDGPSADEEHEAASAMAELLAELADATAIDYGAMHRESQRVPEKFREG